jgi:hypothetical protein
VRKQPLQRISRPLTRRRRNNKKRYAEEAALAAASFVLREK